MVITATAKGAHPCNACVKPAHRCTRLRQSHGNGHTSVATADEGDANLTGENALHGRASQGAERARLGHMRTYEEAEGIPNVRAIDNGYVPLVVPTVQLQESSVSGNGWREPQGVFYVLAFYCTDSGQNKFSPPVT